MYHSLTIGNKNTWDDWRLIPSSRPYVAPPEPRTNYMDIPGMDGSLDYSTILGRMRFKSRTGTWEFIVVNEERTGYRPSDWAKRYSDIMNYISHDRMPVQFEDDPNYIYLGRLRVSGWNSGENWSTITIEYTLDPYKYPSGIGTGQMDWNWDNFITGSEAIYYGIIDVREWRGVNLINPTPSNVIPLIESSDVLEIHVTNPSNLNPAQESIDPLTQLSQTKKVVGAGPSWPIILIPGNNVIAFYGQARVMIDYKIGVSL